MVHTPFDSTTLGYTFHLSVPSDGQAVNAFFVLTRGAILNLKLTKPPARHYTKTAVFDFETSTRKPTETSIEPDSHAFFSPKPTFNIFSGVRASFSMIPPRLCLTS